MLFSFGSPESQQAKGLEHAKNTFALDWCTSALTTYLFVARALIVLCLQEHTGTAMFYLLLQFFNEMLRDLDATCGHFHGKLRSWLQLTLHSVVESRRYSNFLVRTVQKEQSDWGVSGVGFCFWYLSLVLFN